MNAHADGVQPADMTVENWLQLIRAEYREIPGLRLTTIQAQRLWGLDAVLCETLLTALLAGGFLRRTRDAAYIRL